MARTKTTTPTNKKDDTQKPKPGKSKKKSSTFFADEPTAESETSQDSRPLQASLGEQLKAKGTPPNPVRVTNFTRRLPCALSSSDLQYRARRIQELRAQISHENETLDNEKESFEARSKSIKSNVSFANTEINKLTDEIAEQKEFRDTPCQKVEDISHGAGEVREFRTDTSPPQLIHQPRAMNQGEIDSFYASPPSPTQPPPVHETAKSGDDGSGIVEDNYGSSDKDLNARPQDFE